LLNNKCFTCIQPRSRPSERLKRGAHKIAGKLHVSRETVKTETGGLYRKLEVHSRSDAVAKARACGLLPQR
jgi:LuxR family transcriptional regulator, maltose regulon positive regulatory protein